MDRGERILLACCAAILLSLATIDVIGHRFCLWGAVVVAGMLIVLTVLGCFDTDETGGKE